MKASHPAPIASTLSVALLAMVLCHFPDSAKAAAKPMFAARRAFNAGNYPFSVTVGDFNKDGILDLAAAADYFPGGVSVLLGNGDGTFQSAVFYTNANASFLTAITAVDLNHDTNLDLVTSGLAQGAWKMLGNGNGTFQPAAQIQGPSGTPVTFGMLNGDDYLDMVYFNSGTVGVVIQTNKGDGTFNSSSSYYDPGVYANFLAVKDMNNDGREDIVMALAGAGVNQPGGVGVMLGTGNGIFQVPQITTVGTNDMALAIGDFNNDGTNDVALTQYDAGALTILLGHGDGTFTNRATYDVGAQATWVAVGDFNRDGTNDLVVAAGTNAAVLLGNGDGTFQTPTRYDFAKLNAVPGDFNGDGKTDLAVASLNNTTTIGVMLGNGDGTFQSAPHYAVGSNPLFLAMGELNGDGRPELVVANSGANDISVLRNNGDGTFKPKTNYLTGTNPQSLAIADFRGVGTNDVVVANQNSSAVSFLRGNGDGTIQPATTAGSVLIGSSYVLAGDFNNDHKLDIAALALLGLSVFPGNGNGTFQSAATTSGPTELDQMVEADFNGDGKLDLACDNYGGTNVLVMLGNGSGGFQAPVSYFAGTNVLSIALGDFNGDGTNDLAVGGQGSAYPPNGFVAILLSQGDGSFRFFTNYLSGLFVAMAVADFNADGKADLAVVDGGSDPAGNQVDVMLGNGDGTFQPAYGFAVESAPSFIVAGDLNGDGLPDLAVANASSGNISVLLNTFVNFAPSLTVLRINPVDNTITLSWPDSAAGYSLETITNLGSANWQSAAGNQSTNNGTVNFIATIGQGSHFFRLHKN